MGKGLAHKDDNYETPDWLFKDIEKKTGLRFDLDFCATEDNSKCIGYINKKMDALQHKGFNSWDDDDAVWCNPPRSMNGKFVNKVYEEWQKNNINFVMLLCWNDLGNKYGKKLIPHIIDGTIEIGNLGKIKFYKNGKESEFVSRLTYLWVWFKRTTPVKVITNA